MFYNGKKGTQKQSAVSQFVPQRLPRASEKGSLHIWGLGFEHFLFKQQKVLKHQTRAGLSRSTFGAIWHACGLSRLDEHQR